MVFAPGNLRATGVSKADAENPVGIPTAWTFATNQYDMIGSNIEAEYSNEQYFFDVLTNNICEPLNEELKKEKYLHYNLFGEYLVSAYIHYC